MTGKIKTLFTLTLVICLILFIFACSKEGKENKAEAVKDKKEFKVVEPQYDTSLAGREGMENTIRAYNEVLAKVHLADPYFPVLRKYATNKETQRVFVEANFNTEKGVAMRSWLLELVFESISPSEKSGTADTYEIWDFDYIDIKTKEIREPKSRVRYKLKYLLEKEDNKWVVSSIKERQPRVFEQVK